MVKANRLDTVVLVKKDVPVGLPTTSNIGEKEWFNDYHPVALTSVLMKSFKLLVLD